MHTIATGILVPFLGTSLGSACVFFLKNELNENVQRFMTGFAAGVMTAASVWSLLIPALEQASDMGTFAFVPSVIGFWIGILFCCCSIMSHRICIVLPQSLKDRTPNSLIPRCFCWLSRSTIFRREWLSAPYMPAS